MWTELRLATRRLWRTPGFTAAAVLQLALGIGGAAFVYSVVRTLILQPIPYRSPERLVVLSPNAPRWELFRELQRSDGPFARIGAYVERAANLSDQEFSERLLVALVTPEYLTLAIDGPAAGRLFVAEEFTDRASPVAVLTHRTWRARYAGAPDIVGRLLHINGQPHTIVGVLPPDFKTVGQMKRVRDLPFGQEVGAVVPLTESRYRHDPANTDQVQRGLTVVAVVKAGISLGQASLQMAPLLAQESERLRLEARSVGVEMDGEVRMLFVPLSTAVVGELPVQLTALSIAVALLLVVGGGNVLNMLLTRIDARRRDLAIALAIGASARRLALGLVLETGLVAAAGGAAGLLLTWQAVAATRRLAAGVLNVTSLTIDAQVLAFGLALSIGMALALGAVAALWQARTAPLMALQATSHGAAARSALPLSSALVVAQLGLAVLVMTMGAVLARGFIRSSTIAYGFDADRILTAELSLDRTNYGRGWTPHFAELLQRAALLPGVDRAALIGLVPGGPASAATPVTINGRVQFIEAAAASAHYFEVLSIPIVAGVSFSDEPGRTNRDVVVNEALARQHWGAPEKAVGQRLAWVTTAPVQDTTLLERTIVGVVADSRDGVVSSDAQPKMYLSYRHQRSPQMTLLLRASAGAPTALIQPLRALVQEQVPNQPLYNVLPLREILRAPLLRERVLAGMMNGFAALTLLIAALGVYASMAHMGARRRHEIGVRLALGSTRRRVLVRLVRRGTPLLVHGMALGGGLAVLGSAFLRRTLFPTESLDLPTASLAVLVVSVVAAVALLIPAWRATAVDPIVTLRTE